MGFSIEKTKTGWTISSSGNFPTTTYSNLFKLGKALMKYAKGQNL